MKYLITRINIDKIKFNFNHVILHRASIKMASTTNIQTEADRSSHASRLAQINLFETCLIVAVLFFICWVTVQAAIFLYMIDVYPDLSGDHYTVGRLLILFNSCINPYVYTLRYREFKIQLRYLFYGRFARQSWDVPSKAKSCTESN